MVAEVAAERDMRGPGCDERCTVVRALVAGVFGRSELLLHDPESHEAYGRYLAEPRAADDDPEIVTGPLSVNLATLDVSVRGELILLTPTEIRILHVLARRLGDAVPRDDLLSLAWGPEWAGEAHVLRVNMSRLRSRLNVAGYLITTLGGFGYRLEAVPPGDSAATVLIRRFAPLARWSRLWDACRICGTTRVPHRHGGICNRRACRRAARA